MKTFSKRRPTIALALLAPLFALACTGEVTGPSGTTPTDGTPGPAPTGTTPTPAPTGTTPSGGSEAPPMATPPSPTATPTPEAAGPFVMRRLTAREYNHTVADLVGDTTSPGKSFPGDGAADSGFEAPTNVSALHAQLFLEAAETLSATAVTANKLNIPCTNPASTAEAACATQFIQQFGRLAFRRPVKTEEATDLQGLFTKARELGFDFKQSIGQIVAGMLQSPGFIYHWELGPTKPVREGDAVTLTPHQIASRLSTFLWETMPDETLLAAADANQLSTSEQIFAQADRLLKHAKAANVMENFHQQWLYIENMEDLQKDVALYPAFTPAVRDALPLELSSFASSVLVSGDGTLKSLFTAPYTFANQALAAIYGVNAPGTALVQTSLNPQQRSGILTQAAFLATNAASSASHPVKRGVALYRQVLCGNLPPPPADVPEVDSPSANLTTRERYAEHSANPCANCHTFFDGLGFAFENYDGIGAYRTMESGKPVDATGSVTTPNGQAITFTNAIELSKALSESDDVKWCATKQWFRYMLGRKETTSEQGSLELAYRQAAATPGYSLRDVILTAVKTKAFRYRVPAAGETL